ncbi:MAG: hypothetical protein WBP64_21160 [Nitrososphaeraceae archaeon]
MQSDIVRTNSKISIANLAMVSSLSSVSSVSFIDGLPADKHAYIIYVLNSGVDNIWTAIANNHPELRPNEVSKDISLESIVTHGLTIKTTIHHTDAVSIIVACSLNPVAVDLKRPCTTFECANSCRGATATIYRMRAPITVTVTVTMHSRS